MNRRRSCMVAFLALGLAAGPAQLAAVELGSASDVAAPLQIHLPREVTVQSGFLTLGQVSVVKGDPVLVAAANKIGLGQLSVPGQKAVLDRPTILSRLASSGIGARQVRLTGAETVMVRRCQKTVSAGELIDAGRAFLQRQAPSPAVCEILPTVKPKDLTLAGQPRDVQLAPRLVRNGSAGHATVQIVVTADGAEVGVRDIPFRLRYQCHRVVTTQEVPAGAALRPENVRIETVVMDQPEPAGWQPPYGLVALRTLPADTELRRDMIGAARSPVVIRRNDTVVIRVERPGLVVTAVGLALQEGRAGEYVKIRNTDSSRVIVCKVNADGTVEPMI